MKLAVLIGLLGCAAVCGAAAAYICEHRYVRPCPAHHFAIIGDSNVYAMDLGPQCVNLGVAANTSKDMAERFAAKSIATFGQKTVVIWATTNDTHRGQNNGVRYIRQMALEARSEGLRVVLTTPLPMIDKTLAASPDDALGKLSGQVVALGRSEHIAVADVRAAVGSGNKPDMLFFATDSDGSVMHLNRLGRIVALRTIARAMD
jgi:hypothetical protein